MSNQVEGPVQSMVWNSESDASDADHWITRNHKPDDVYNLQRQLLSAGFIFLITSTKSNKYVKLFFILWKHYNKLNYFIVKERLTAAEARGTKEIIRFYMFFCMYYVNNNGPYKIS